MTRKITLRSWATLALLAMLAVFSSPALAFACCCQSAPVAPSPAAPSASSHPSDTDADGCCEDTSDKAREQHTPATSHTHLHAAAPGTACISAVCHCPHAASTAMLFVDSQSASVFSPVVSGTIAARFTVNVSADERIAVYFASRALRPRPPTNASRSGRAPPVFSLLS